MSIVISVCSDGLHPDLMVPSALIPLVKVLADIDPSAPSLHRADIAWSSLLTRSLASSQQAPPASYWCIVLPFRRNTRGTSTLTQVRRRETLPCRSSILKEHRGTSSPTAGKQAPSYRSLHSEEEVCRTDPSYNKTLHTRRDKVGTRKVVLYLLQ